MFSTRLRRTTTTLQPPTGQDLLPPITERILQARTESCLRHPLRPRRSHLFVSPKQPPKYSRGLCLHVCPFCPSVSGSNLASHMVGSLKKGAKQSMSLPSTAYNTLPAHVHNRMRSVTSSPKVIGAGQSQTPKTGSHSKTASHHKRSPSSDSGTGSNTPVSSYHSGKVHHTVFLHGTIKLNTKSNLGNSVTIFSSFSVGPKSGGSSDTSPPLQSFAEESSPENLNLPSRIVNGQSTESLDSLSDESGGLHGHRSRAGGHARTSSGNPVPPPRKVNIETNPDRDKSLLIWINSYFSVITLWDGDVGRCTIARLTMRMS